LLTWLDDEPPFGFSSADKIAFGQQAHMHLHVTRPGDRRRGLGWRRCGAAPRWTSSNYA
jgi:hypothetical protein